MPELFPKEIKGTVNALPESPSTIIL